MPCEEGELFYVDPTTGKVTNLSTSTAPSNAAQVSFWTVESLSILATRTQTSMSGTISPPNPIKSFNPTGSIESSNVSANPSQLTAGASAGIAVGCVTAISTLGAVIWLFLRKRKKRRALETQALALALEMSTHQSEVDAKVVYAHRAGAGQVAGTSPQELEDRARNEVP